jgi:hypothetical protein
VRVKDIIRAPKTVTAPGAWKQEKMPQSAFPLRKGKRPAYMLKAQWRWRLVHFKALGESFRLLIAWRPDIEEYLYYLGQDIKGDTRVVLALSFHGTHPGWHVHTHCGHVEELPVGVMRSHIHKRIPRGMHNHRCRELVPNGGQMSDAIATDIAFSHLNLHETSGGLFARLRRRTGHGTR